MHIQYRPEIDGLRAIAIVPVVLFHAGFEFFSGGFIGVDIFFVISGYLITRIILKDLSAGEFSILQFYERRVRRLLPALFLVMIITVPFAWMWMLPQQFKDFGQSLIGVTLFSSNFLFWVEAGYFVERAELKPLLHSWSLAVEEQFYLVFPPLMLLVWRYLRQHLFIILSIIAIASLSISMVVIGLDPEANFYLAPTRMWELLIGSLCAYWGDKGVERQNNYFAIFGFILILYAIFAFDQYTPFPGPYSLIPIVGTALIILFGSRTSWVGRLLSWRPIVGMGLISYSVYLWHQPLLSFARLRSLYAPSAITMFALVIGSVLLGYLSWRFVETPVRRNQVAILRNRSNLFGSAFGVAVLFLVIGIVIHVNKGEFDGRINPNVKPLELSEKIKVNVGLKYECNAEEFELLPGCSTSEEPEFLLWGDSHAMHLAPALMASDPELKLQQHTRSACAPILGLALVDVRLDDDFVGNCISYNEKVMSWLEQSKTTQYVIISSKFNPIFQRARNADGETIEEDEGGVVTEAFLNTIKRIEDMGKSVVVVSSTPQNGEDLGKCLTKLILYDIPKDKCDFSTQDYAWHTTQTNNFLSHVEQHAQVIWLSDLICENGICDVERNGIFLFRDMDHLAIEGSAYLGEKYNLMHLVRGALGLVHSKPIES